MAMIRCPECGREISTMAPACPGCGILKEDIQKLLESASGNQKPLTRETSQMLTCVACHEENEEGNSPVCKACGYPLLSLTSDKKKMKIAVEAYKWRETQEKPVQVTDTPEKPEPDSIKPTPIKPKTQELKPIPPTPPTGKKSGKTKAIALAVAGVACASIVLFLKIKPELQPVASAESTVSAESENVESVSELETSDTHKLSGNYNIGDTLTFGSYEQDNNPNNGTEEIEWLVLDKDEEGYLLISKYGLDEKPYNEDFVDVTWETSTLRSWLNGDFYTNAFGSVEREQIRTTHVIAEKNPKYGTESGNSIDDPVFLLSIQEAEKYFTSDEERKTYKTEYVGRRSKFGWWWLRSLGGNSHRAAYVRDDGWVNSNGDIIDRNGVCIRPALWVNL